MDTSTRDPGTFRVVIPVKDVGRAKSRLDVDPADRRDLAFAFALDTVATSAACSLVEDVIVATGDRVVAEAAGGCGATILQPRPGGSLNADLAWALEKIGGPGPTAVLMADLPALTEDDLREALDYVRDHPGTCFVEDLRDGGTTMLASRHGRLVPQFGRASASRYIAAGATKIGSELMSLRCDVDNVPALRRAARIGVGPRTRALVTQDRLVRSLATE